jgi:5'-nucleotidase|tara:strand:+ start:359 stop:829 length:471 start_codon:yes stop_codon:yes gene_type:complete
MSEMTEMKKKIVYFDMDNTLVNFQSAIDQLPKQVKKSYNGELDNVPGIFSKMKPINEMVHLFNQMAADERYDVYILSTSPWDNPTAASDKVAWVKKYLPLYGYKRLILSHNKHLNIGDYLIDDRTANGAGEFTGELIQYGTEKFPTAQSIKTYLNV